MVEKSNWTGRAVVCPRSQFREAKPRPEFRKMGVLQGRPFKGRIEWKGEAGRTLKITLARPSIRPAWANSST
jgi:hypothetical protein